MSTPPVANTFLSHSTLEHLSSRAEHQVSVSSFLHADFSLADVMSPQRRTDNVKVVDDDGVREGDKNPAQVGAIFDRYWITNSMSGLYHIRISDGRKRRYFWMLVRH